MERISLTAFFPAYNDEHTIEKLVRVAVEEIGKITDDFEVVIVNDGSKDKTAEIADRLSLEMPRVRAVHHPHNLGYGAALITGFKTATKDLVFYTDGDAQYDPAEMELLWRQMQADVDLVNGYKISRSDPVHRIVIGRLYHYIVSILFGLTVRDVDCDFRLIRRNIFETLSLESQSGVICVEMAKKFEVAGFRMKEVPVSHYPRLHGRSEFFRVRHLAHTLRGLIRVWWNLVLLHRLPVWMTTATRKS